MNRQMFSRCAIDVRVRGAESRTLPARRSFSRRWNRDLSKPLKDASTATGTVRHP